LTKAAERKRRELRFSLPQRKRIDQHTEYVSTVRLVLTKTEMAFDFRAKRARRHYIKELRSTEWESEVISEVAF